MGALRRDGVVVQRRDLDRAGRRGGGIVGGGLVLRANRQTVLANIVLAILATPGILFVLFFGLLIALNPRWN